MKKIPLTQGKHALVDDEDYEWLNQWKWCFDKYAIRRISRKNQKSTKIYMHRLIMKPERLSDTDHINRNRLDNRRCNLRNVTHQQNAWNITIPKHNTSGFMGVSWHNKTRKWQVGIKLDGKRIYIGLFSQIQEAIDAYQLAKEKYHRI